VTYVKRDRITSSEAPAKRRQRYVCVVSRIAGIYLLS